MSVPLSGMLKHLGASIDELGELPMPVFIVDHAGLVRWLNHSAREFYGPIIGKPYSTFVATDYLSEAKERFARKIVGTDVATTADTVVLDRDAKRHEAEVSTVSLTDDHRVVGVFGVVHLDAMPASVVPKHPVLTPRQAEVMRCLAMGSSTEEIAQKLGISKETVRNHIRGILRAFGVHSRLEAVIEGYRRLEQE